MKKIYFLVLLFWMSSVTYTKAQKSVDIYYVSNYYAEDTTTSIYCVPMEITFEVCGYATGYSPGDSITLKIDYRDGVNKTIRSEIIFDSIQYFCEKFTHTYSSQGIYSPRYAAVGDGGGGDTLYYADTVIIYTSCCSAKFNYYADSINPNTYHFVSSPIGVAPFTYSWNFGDGNTSNLANPTHTYATQDCYTISLTITDSTGYTSTCYEYTCSNPCSAYFTCQIDTTTKGLIHFVGNSSGTAPFTYSWDFGDSTYSTLENPSHLYANQGWYGVSLTITDSLGCVSTYYEYIYINPCLTTFSYVVDSLTPGLVNFTSYSHGVSPITYYWDLGNGDTSTLANPSVIYDTKGYYCPYVYTIDSTGCESYYYNCFYLNTPESNMLNIEDSYFYFYDSSYCDLPQEYYFEIYGVHSYKGGDTIQIIFDYGDGTTDDFTIATDTSQYYFWQYAFHEYNAAGVYQFKAIVIGTDGKSDTIQSTTDVHVADSCSNIYGRVYHDNNSNCIYDSGDEPAKFWYVYAYTSDYYYYYYAQTDSAGYYNILVPPGIEYTLEPYYYNPYSVLCPSSGSYTIKTFPSIGNDFAMICESINDDGLSAYVWGFVSRSANSGIIWAEVCGEFCDTVISTVKIIIDDRLTYDTVYGSSSSTYINGDTIVWENVKFDGSYCSYFDFYVIPDSTLNIGDTVCITVIAESLSGESTTSTVCVPVLNSWDPNNKLVYPMGEGEEGNILPNTTLTYLVNFQNMGNDVAYNVNILDTLDANLDMNTFRIIGNSHPMKAEIKNGNIINFKFDNIMLPDSNSNEPESHGFVKYQVKTKEGLAIGTQIKNTAHIYFDFNPAIVTNTTLNTISQPLSVQELSKSKAAFSIYPNPAQNQVNIVSEVEGISVLHITDAIGRDVAVQNINHGLNSVDISQLQQGMYYITIRNESHIETHKLSVIK